MTHVRYDGTGLGFLMSLELLINQQPVLIINGYWPVKPSSIGGKGLWNKIQSWLDRRAEPVNPLQYIQELVAKWITQHVAKHDGRQCTVLSGDLNSTLTRLERGGTLPSYVGGADDVGLTDVIGIHAAANGVDLRTYWRGDKAVSSIDHILINNV